MTSYLETLTNLQNQGLETLKQAQAVQLTALTSVRDAVASIPGLPKVPAMEGFPTVAELIELNGSFATKVLEQQNAFVAQVAGVLSPAAK